MCCDFCVKQSHKKKAHTVFNNNNMIIEMKSDIKLSTNPSYDITRQNKNQHNEPNYVLYNKNTVETIKMDSNPSYGTVQSGNIYDANQPAYDAAIQPNPSYSSIPKKTTKCLKMKIKMVMLKLVHVGFKKKVILR